MHEVGQTSIASALSSHFYHVALIASPLLLPSFLPSLFYTANTMESFVTATGRITRGGGSSHANSSHATGKAPAVPQKRASKASGGRRRKRPKTTINTIKPEPEPESLTYHESESESNPKAPPSRPSAKLKQIKVSRSC